jgi:short-subunit dehydrogenase
MKGKFIVITGNSSGIGKRLFDSLGKDNTVVGLCRSGGENSIVCDISSIESIERAVEQIKKMTSRVDVLINNAGYGLTGACELLTDEAIKRIFDVDEMGAIYLTKRLLPLMDKGSKVVNITSACALFPLPYRTMYCASKAGMHMYSLGLKMEVEPFGIDVTSICPGDVKTPFTVNRLHEYPESERYGDRIRKADEKVASRNDKRMDEKKVCDKIYKIIDKAKYKPFYIVGAKYKVFWFFKKILPESVFTFFIKKFAL